MGVQKNNYKLTKEWLDKAKEDELSARDILENRGGSPSTVCFLSQQMAEKYLKGYLVYKRERFPKMHQLDQLVRLCEKIEPKFKDIMEEAKYLTEFYITTRYPGDYPQFSFKDAERAFEKALKIVEFVKSRLNGF